MDEIRLHGLRLLGTHGVLAEEQARPQPFEVEISLGMDLAEASRSDDLTSTVDYGEVVAVVASIVGGERFALLERLAGRIAEATLELDPRIARVTVTVAKLRPPVPHDLGSASVHLTRDRP